MGVNKDMYLSDVFVYNPLNKKWRCANTISKHSVLNTKLSWMGSLTRWTYTLYTWRWKLWPLLSHIKPLNRITTPQSHTLAQPSFAFYLGAQRFHRRDQVLPVIETHLSLHSQKNAPLFRGKSQSRLCQMTDCRCTQDGHGWFVKCIHILSDAATAGVLTMIWWHQRQPRHSAKPPPKPHAKAVCFF